MAHQTEKLIFAETEKLEYRYITLNDLWERREIPDKSIYGENMEFIANMRTMTERVESEVKDRYLTCDEQKIGVLLSGILSALQRNKALYEEKYAGLKVKDSSKLKDGPDLLRNQCLSTAKIIFEHSLIVEDFINKYTQTNVQDSAKTTTNDTLNLSQKILLIHYLQEHGLFPKPKTDIKPFSDGLISKLIGQSKKNVYDKMREVGGVKSNIKTEKNLSPIHEIFKELGFKEIAETIYSDINKTN